MKKESFELGDKVSDESAKAFGGELQRVAPPVVLAVQPDSFIRLESPEALRSWEKAVKATTGLELSGAKFAGVATESCSAGCTDDSDVC